MARPSTSPTNARLAAYADHALRLRRVTRIQALTVAAFIGAGTALAVGSGTLGAGATAVAVAGVAVAAMAVLVAIAALAPPRLMGPADPMVELDVGADGLHAVTASGRQVDLGWRDPRFALVLQDYSRTGSKTSNVVRLHLGSPSALVGGVSDEDSDMLVHQARAQGLSVARYQKPWGILSRDQFIAETVVRPHANATSPPTA